MATTTLILQPNLRTPKKGLTTSHNLNPRSRNKLIFIKAQQDDDARSEGQSVDENMIVLRMRIKKMKLSESVKGASSDWKEWERNILVKYHEGVCDSMETLQTYLMNTRPSVALGMLALIAMTVPLSSSVVMANALKLVKGILAGCHVCIDIDF